MKLSDLKVSTKKVSVEFPGLEGFKVDVGYATREVSNKIREASKVSKFDHKLKMPVESLDEDRFITEFAKACVLGWSGLKLKYLSELLLVDLSQVEDPEEELPYSLENAVDLIKGSQSFDTWVNEVVFDLDRFRD